MKLVAQLSALLVWNGLHQADALADETRPVIYFLLEHLTGSGQCGRNWSSFHLSVLHNLFSFMLGSFLNSLTEEILCVVQKFPCHLSSLSRKTCIVLFTKGYPMFWSSSSSFSLVLFGLNMYCIRGTQKIHVLLNASSRFAVKIVSICLFQRLMLLSNPIFFSVLLLRV